MRAPLLGTLLLSPDGSFVYTPAAGSAGGPDSFVYRAVSADGLLASADTFVNLAVSLPPPPPPVAPVRG